MASLLEKVAKFWNDFSLEHSTIKINIHSTVQIFNVMYFYEFPKMGRTKVQDQIDSSNFDYLIEYHFVSPNIFVYRKLFLIMQRKILYST